MSGLGPIPDAGRRDLAVRSTPDEQTSSASGSGPFHANAGSEHTHSITSSPRAKGLRAPQGQGSLRSLDYCSWTRLQPTRSEFSCRGAHAVKRIPARLQDLRAKANLSNQIKLIWAVQSWLQKYSASRLTQISDLCVPSRSQGGAARDRHGRRERDAVDAGGATDESTDCGRRSRVVLTPRRRRQVGGGNSADDGDKKARSPGRSRRKPLKPLRRECRVIPV
jgi:hypothetical protein